MARGSFIVVEGLDGAGTTTQCAALAERLRALGREVLVTCEPSTGPIGVQIRQALSGRLGLASSRDERPPLTAPTLALMFAADRMDHLASEIEPALRRGAVVLCDRYVLSSLAYQGPTVGVEWVQQINAHALAPDLTLFLKIDVKSASARRAVRQGAAELYERDDIQQRTARWYERAIALRRKCGDRIEIIDGRLPVSEVTERCLAEIRPKGRRK